MKTVMVVTEGQSDVLSLRKVGGKISVLLPLSFRIVQMNCDPNSATSKKLKCLDAPLRMAIATGVDMVVITLDREQQHDSARALGASLETAIANHFSGVHKKCPTIRVVLKDRMLENWLIADLDALRMQPKRYKVEQSTVNQVEPNRADKIVDASSLLRNICISRNKYSKTRDGETLAGNLDIMKAAKHSESFRNFLEVLGVPLTS